MGEATIYQEPTMYQTPGQTYHVFDSCNPKKTPTKLDITISYLNVGKTETEGEIHGELNITQLLTTHSRAHCLEHNISLSFMHLILEVLLPLLLSPTKKQHTDFFFCTLSQSIWK